MQNGTIVTNAALAGIGVLPQIAIVCAMAVIVVMMVLQHRIRMKSLREHHLATHPSLSNDEFLQQIKVPVGLVTIATGVRQSVARAMGVPVESVYPSDTLEYICQFGFDNMDFVEIVVEIEQTLGVPFVDSFWDPLFPANKTLNDVHLGDLTKVIAANWTALSAGI